MASTPNKKEKISDLIKNWEEYKTMTQEEIGAKLRVSGRTVYAWRKELGRRGLKLETEVVGKTDKNLFDSFAK